MKTKKSKTTYEVHGREFQDQAAAERFEILLNAKEIFEDARKNLGRLLAESFTTADGEPFRFQHWFYYHVFTPHNAMPRLFEVSFTYWGWDFEAFYEGDQTDLVLYTAKDPWGNDCDRRHGYPIRELYADKKKAEAALRVAQREWLEEEMERLVGGDG